MDLWSRRRHFAPLLIVPVVFYAGYSMIQDEWIFPNIEDSSVAGSVYVLGEWFALGIPFTIVFAVFAIACHRSILLGPFAVSTLGYQGWTRRETRFAFLSFFVASATGALFGMSFFWGFMAIEFLNVCAGLLRDHWQLFPWDQLEEGSILIFVASWLSIFVVAYPLGRISLVFPATALDQIVSLKWAWQTSAPHALRLWFLAGVLPLGSVLCQSFVAELSGDWLGPVLPNVLEGILYSILLIAEIEVLSISYREIVGVTSV